MFNSTIYALIRYVSLLPVLLMGLVLSTPANAAGGNVDLMLILDESGSMLGSTGSDPNNIRYSATKQLMSSLTNGAVVQNAGLVFFASTAKLAVPLSPIGTAVTSINALATSTGAGTISGGSTNTAAAIQIAADAFTVNSTTKKVIVVFTDGGADDQSAAVAAAAAAAAKGITVNIIALGSAAASYSKPVADAGRGVVLTATDPNQLIALFGSSAIITGSTISQEVQKATTTAVVAQVQRATTIQQAVTIINVLSSIGNPRAAMGPQRIQIGSNKSGMAAGGSAEQWNAWLNASRASIGNTYQNLTIGADTRFEGNVDNLIGGIDYGLNKDWVVGASFGFDKTTLDTAFNNGSLTSNGAMIAPYVSFQLNKVVSLDAIIGYAEGDSTIQSNLFGPTNGSQQFTRNFGALNLSATQWAESWQLTGKVSYLVAEEKLKDYTDSIGSTTFGQTNRMQQIRLSGQVGYWKDGIMPYAGLTYSNDISAPTSVVSGFELPQTRDSYTYVIGVSVFGKNVMGNVNYSQERGRENNKNNVLMGSLGYRF